MRIYRHEVHTAIYCIYKLDIDAWNGFKRQWVQHVPVQGRHGALVTACRSGNRPRHCSPSRTTPESPLQGSPYLSGIVADGILFGRSCYSLYADLMAHKCRISESLVTAILSGC